jgi:hypothetical protein
MKFCNKCKIFKSYDSFSKNKRKKDGYHTQCKFCTKIYKDSIKEKISIQNKEWNLNNKEKIQFYNQQYNTLNPIKKRSYTYNWFKDNPLYSKNWKKQKYQNSLLHKIKDNFRSRFYHALIKGNKINSIFEIIGCSVEELKLYLEQQFKPEMNWENHGEIWEIDHIKACSHFDLTKPEEQKQCFHYTNLQPLFKTTEISRQYGYTNEIGNRNKNKY